MLRITLKGLLRAFNISGRLVFYDLICKAVFARSFLIFQCCIGLQYFRVDMERSKNVGVVLFIAYLTSV